MDESFGFFAVAAAGADDFIKEEFGAARVIEALSTNSWTGMRVKNKSANVGTPLDPEDGLCCCCCFVQHLLF